MIQPTIEQILAWQGGELIEYTDEASEIVYETACDTIGKVNFHPDTQHFLIARNLHLSPAAFIKGSAAGNQTSTAHKIGADYQVFDANGEVYQALVWEQWQQIQNLLAAVNSIQEKLATPEAKAAMVERWKIATGQIPDADAPSEPVEQIIQL